jgi:hypothetical protein
MDNSTEVQPTGTDVVAGQGQESSGLYDLSSIPEQLRPAVEPAFKQWEANVTKKFQDHSEYRKSWEPYEQLGVNKVDPQQLQELLSFNEMASDPEQFDAWLREAAMERGLLEQAQQEPSDPYADLYGDTGLQDQLTPDSIKQMISEQISPLMEQAQQQQQQAALQEATDQIQTELDSLHEQHGDFPDEVICQLAMAYDGPQGIQQAFQDYQNIIAQTERGVVESKLAEPSVPERGGANTTAPPEIKTWEQARDAAISRLRQSVQA